MGRLLAGLAAAMVATTVASAKDLQAAAPASVGMSAAGLGKLKSDMAGLVADGRRAGIVYIVLRKGKVVAHEAIGSRELESGAPMTKDTVFRIYSMSRAITAAATLALVEQGRLDLDDPVSKFIPEVAKTPVIKTVVNGEIIETEPQATPMTVRHLFTYTSGLGYGFDWPKGANFSQDAVVPLEGGTLEQGMKALAGYPLLHQPGSKWFYGFSGDMLGRVAEVAARQPFDQFLQTTVLDKVGMKDTGFWTTPERLSGYYQSTKDDPTLKPTRPYPLSTYDRPGTFFSAGGGLVTTAMDYARFAQMLLNEGQIDGVRVLRPETVRMMLSRQTTPEQGLVFWYRPGGNAEDTNAGYAWGLSIGVRVEDQPHTIPGSPGDVGWAGLGNTFFFIDPKEELVAVAMSQYVGPDDEVLLRTLRAGVYGALPGRR